MQTGSVLTLNFYSNPIDIMVGDDHVIYVNWEHYCNMIGADPEIAPHLLRRGEFDVDYIAFSYVADNACGLTYDHPDPLFVDLLVNEFPNYIIKELGLIRELIPMINLSAATHETGIFSHEGVGFVLIDKLEDLVGHVRVTIPDDVPRFPVMAAVHYEEFTEFGRPAIKKVSAFPAWIVELSSLPHIIEVSHEVDRKRCTVTNRPGEAHYRVAVPEDSELGFHLGAVETLVRNQLNEKEDHERFVSPEDSEPYRNPLRSRTPLSPEVTSTIQKVLLDDNE